MKHPRRYIRSVVAAIALALLVVCIGISWGRDVLSQRRVERINQLVKVGMDIEQAYKTLEADGFFVDGNNWVEAGTGDQYEKYMQTTVRVRMNPPFTTLRYVMGWPPSDKKTLVILQSNLEGIITSIE